MKNIMFQGTASSVGKSIITSGICRVLRELSYNIAPFKSQNISSNSFITRDGKEIGIAQAVQAEAAKIEPVVEMNPILLKPLVRAPFQAIVMGEFYKNMRSTEYDSEKPALKKVITDAYTKLKSQYDIIVIEGAGSTAEINLKKDDIVNMGIAEMVDSPVVLIGDIDRGGVFASIYGTFMLLEKKERKRIKGFIINKFIGDVQLLMTGIEMLEEKINVPCLGVVPFFEIDIDEEDGYADKKSRGLKRSLEEEDSLSQHREEQYNNLAAIIRENIKIDKIIDIIEKN